MPARDPALSPRSLLPSTSAPKSAMMPALTSHHPNNWGFYLPDTSADYENPDDNNSEDGAGPHQSSRTPPPTASGSSWLVGSYQNSPKRPTMQRRGSSSTFRSEVFSDTPDLIRSRTAYLSDLPYRRSSSHLPSSFIDDDDHRRRSMESDDEDGARESEPLSMSIKSQDRRPLQVAAMPRLEPLSERNSPVSDSPSSSPGNAAGSGLTRMFARDKSRSPRDSPEPSSSAADPRPPVPEVVLRRPTEDLSTGTLKHTSKPASTAKINHTTIEVLETAPLLPPALGSPQSYGTHTPLNLSEARSNPFSSKSFVGRTVARVQQSTRILTRKSTYADVIKDATSSLPAVILGLLLNVLDGVSYGFIMFPTGAIFAGFGGIGVSMFFVTTIVAQLAYSLGGSMFAGANGSMMIEVVPFFHILVNGIIESVGEDNPESVIATTMVAFSFSSIITGITFYLLGHFKLGNIIGFFPRHILVGCIGGVGVFLVETGLEVSASLNDSEGFTYTWKTAKLFLTNPHVLSLWLPAFGLAVLLRLITHRFNHQLIFPMYFLAIPIIFYIVVAILGLNLDTLRSSGWVFDVGAQTTPWYQFYRYFNLKQTSFKALMATMPTQLALLFFNILHPPLNVPALAVSLNADDVDTNRELVAHGVSNVLAGCLGTVPNYLVYVNTLMFYRVGGGSRISGLMLAAGTAVLLVVGTGPIGYIPIMLVGALIFVLGIDLIKEAVWDTRHRTSTSEYVTIIAIMVCMSLWDFVVGVLFGIVLACFFFVIQNSQRRSVRTMYTGASSMSTVRRPSAHREYLREVGKQTVIMRLQGFLFFGTINFVEDTIRQFLDHAAWQKHPIRFLIIDLSLVAGLDMSSAEAFCRVHRLLVAKGVIMVFCGVTADSTVAKALQAVDLWTDHEVDIEVFEVLNDALEWTENAYLRAWFQSPLQQKIERVEQPKPMAYPGRQQQKSPIALGESFANSPRRNQLHDVGTRIIAPEMIEAPQAFAAEPVNTLLKAFSSHLGDLDETFFAQLIPYLKQIAVPEGHVLFKQDDAPDALYFIEHGVLRATYRFNVSNAQPVEESMVSGTLAGELSALSGMPRPATVVAERQSVLWKLSLDELARLEREQPEAARKFVKLILKAAKTDIDVLLSSMATRA